MTCKKNYYSKIFIGTSGWNYKHWKGNFYPEDVKQRVWLEYYTKKFNSVELNVTFYRLPEDKTFENWVKRTPEDFKFIVKASRYITHIKRLSSPEDTMPKLLDKIYLLKEKLGLVLFQTPPSLKKDEQLLENFLIYINKQDRCNIKPVFEFRHKSWIDEKIFGVLKENKAAFCFSDYGDMDVELPSTADYVYIRRHGTKSLGQGNYSGKALKSEAEKIKIWLDEGKEIYAFFNNDIGGYAPRNAIKLREFILE